MSVNNSLVQKQQRVGITAYLNSEKVLGNIEQALGKAEKQRFITGVISAVNTNPALSECTNQSILSGALLGESLKLSPSPQLGHYYLVPFSTKTKDANGREVTIKAATFQMGYKGYIQLAIRSGQYKKLTVLAIKKGELEHFDPLNEEIRVNLMVDKWDEREEAETIGYFAMFELVNGFRKAIYWSKKQMENHALKYSQGYKAKKGYTFWEKNFDMMAYKTMLRQLISKWGVMSTEMQSAFERDMTFETTSGDVQYIEPDDNIIDMQPIEETPTEPTPPQPPKAESSGDDVQAALFGK